MESKAGSAPNRGARAESVRLRTVSIIGPSRADVELLRVAEAVGGEIARRGLVLITGGHGGVMEAACRGAVQAGGLTVGLLRTESAADANPFVKVAIPTGIGEARNLAVALAGTLVVAVGSSAGTLTEIAYASKHRRSILVYRPAGPVPGVSWTEFDGVEAFALELDRRLGAARYSS